MISIIILCPFGGSCRSAQLSLAKATSCRRACGEPAVGAGHMRAISPNGCSGSLPLRPVQQRRRRRRRALMIYGQPILGPCLWPLCACAPLARPSWPAIKRQPRRSRRLLPNGRPSRRAPTWTGAIWARPRQLIRVQRCTKSVSHGHAYDSENCTSNREQPAGTLTSAAETKVAADLARPLQVCPRSGRGGGGDEGGGNKYLDSSISCPPPESGGLANSRSRSLFLFLAPLLRTKFLVPNLICAARAGHTDTKLA